MKLSGIVITKNEEENIERCLKSLLFCDEVIVVDDESTDKTKEMAKKIGARVVERRSDEDFGGQRNFAGQLARGEWVLFVDADEVVTDNLKDEIQMMIKEKRLEEKSACHIKRRDFFWGREVKFGEVWTARRNGPIRLMKKESGKWEGRVHEEFKTLQPVGQLVSYLDHYPHPTIKEFLQSINTYSSLRARELYGKGKKDSIIKTVLFPLGKFIYTYFFKLGFIDGPGGFVYAFMMSFHSFLVRAKLYQYWNIPTSPEASRDEI